MAKTCSNGVMTIKIKKLKRKSTKRSTCLTQVLRPLPHTLTPYWRLWPWRCQPRLRARSHSSYKLAQQSRQYFHRPIHSGWTELGAYTNRQLSVSLLFPSCILQQPVTSVHNHYHMIRVEYHKYDNRQFDQTDVSIASFLK